MITIIRILSTVVVVLADVVARFVVAWRRLRYSGPLCAGCGGPLETRWAKGSDICWSCGRAMWRRSVLDWPATWERK